MSEPSNKYARAALLGVAALGFYAVHGGVHLARGEPEDLLWACHLGAALVGFGLLAQSSAINAVGTLFLAMGTPLWLMELAAGEEFLPSSCLTHVGGLAIGLRGVRVLGMPKGTAWKSAAALVALIALCRLLTPERANVNVAFRIQPGWESYFSSYRVYLVVIIAEAFVYFVALEFVLRRWLAPAAGERKPP